MTISNYMAQKLLDHMIGKTTFALPSGLYLALTTAAPTPASTGSSFSEITTGTYVGYTRLSVLASDFTATDGNRQLVNGTVLTFATPTAGSSGTYTHCVLIDAATGGNIFAYGAITGQPVTIVVGSPPSFPVGSLIFQMD